MIKKYTENETNLNLTTKKSRFFHIWTKDMPIVTSKCKFR